MSKKLERQVADFGKSIPNLESCGKFRGQIFMVPQGPNNEAVNNNALWQSESAAAFADITRLAAYICGTPMALLCLIDGTRHSFNLELPEMRGEVDFWAHAIVQSEVLQIGDISQDVRFANNSIVKSSPNVRFYAGAPLIAPDGHAIGVLCVLDVVARSLSPQQAEALQALSRTALRSREMHRHVNDLTETAIEFRQLKQALQRSEEEYLTLLDRIEQGIFILQKGKLSYANQSFAKILGYSVAEMTGMNFSALAASEEPTSEARRYRQELAEKGRECAFCLLHKDWATRVKVRVQLSSILYRGSPANMAIVKEIFPSQRRELPFLSDASYDPLKGLLNQSGLVDCLEVALKWAKRDDSGVAVLFLDIDRFKRIKHSLGHPLAEQLLVALGRRLETCLRPGDRLARIGSDEFAGILYNIEQIEEALSVAESIQEALKAPFYFDGQDIFISASIGIATNCQFSVASHQQAVNSCNGERPEDLLRNAGIAMYSAKTLGKGNYQVFDTEMHTNVLERWQLETDLRRAILGKGEVRSEKAEIKFSLLASHFCLHYQPIVSLDTGKLAGFEALVRWNHPTRGLVSPAEFIPVTEQTALIIPLGAWVLWEACRQLRQWQAQFSRALALTMSVNLSGIQLSQPNLIGQIDEILQQTGVDAACLKLEITESVLMDNAAAAAEVLDRLRERNIQLCIDDFGTGYSSLSYLRRFPVSTLKIDRSFVRGMSCEEENLEIVRAIKTLANNLGMYVVAEGVETEEQLVQLWGLHCEYGQGYFFSKPLDTQAASALIACDPQW